MYALSVMLSIDPAHCEEFRHAALRHAGNTKTNETGCLIFDVFVAQDNPNRFYFHEVYVNKAAVEEVHNKAPYLAEFRKKIGDWVLSQEILAWTHADEDNFTLK
jgi:autoinducer 2-degrading protein